MTGLRLALVAAVLACSVHARAQSAAPPAATGASAAGAAHNATAGSAAEAARASTGDASSLAPPASRAATAPAVPPPAPTAERAAGGAPVTYREEVAFWVYADVGERNAAQRAREASIALAAALDTKAEAATPDGPLASVVVREGLGQVRVRGVLVALLRPQDASAAGYPDLPSYSEHVQAQLMEFVPAQLRRGSLQRTVLHIFLSVFLGLLAALALRQLRSAFDRLDETLESRRGALPALTIFKLPLMSSDAVGGALALAAVLGRWLAYLATLALGGVAVLGQFDTTRPWLARAGREAGLLVITAVQAVGGAVPSLLLAAGLVLLLQGTLRVVDVLLAGVKSGRLHWAGLPPERVGVARVWVRATLWVLALPLLVAAVFGRFGTPLETVALTVAGVVLLAGLPVVAAAIAGGVVLWRQALKAGDWVEVGAQRGEVTSISLLAVTLVPDEGGTVTIPTLGLLWQPVRRLPAPVLQVQVTVAKKASGREVVEAVKRVVTPVTPDCRVMVRQASGQKITLVLELRHALPGVRSAVWLALMDAHDRGELELLEPGAA